MAKRQMVVVDRLAADGVTGLQATSREAEAMVGSTGQGIPVAPEELATMGATSVSS